MTVLSLVIGVMLLTDPGEGADGKALRAAVAREADSGMEAERPKAEKNESARIVSVRSDFDRKTGVAMFEGNVVIRYAADFTLCTDRLYLFMTGSNRVNRVVALGSVSITNASRVGTCERATFRRLTSEVEMFGDGAGRFARLVESDGGRRSLEGTRIKFWLDAEQVEVDGSAISSETEGKGRLP